MTKNAPTTKKMLVAFDSANPGKASSDFLVPVPEKGEFVFLGTKSKRNAALGMVVFVGRDVSVNDVFARLVDSGREIPSVAEELNYIADYLKQIDMLKVGQVVRLSGDLPRKAFVLEEVQIPKSPNKRSLP